MSRASLKPYYKLIISYEILLTSKITTKATITTFFQFFLATLCLYSKQTLNCKPVEMCAFLHDII